MKTETPQLAADSPARRCSAFEPGQLLHKHCVGVDYLWHELDAEVKAMWSTAEANLFNEMTTTMRNRFAKEMLAHGFSTGHGDTVEDLLHELWDQIEQNPTGQAADHKNGG